MKAAEILWHTVDRGPKDKTYKWVRDWAASLKDGSQTVIEFPHPFMFEDEVQSWDSETLIEAILDYRKVKVGREIIQAFMDDVAWSYRVEEKGINLRPNVPHDDHPDWGQF